MTIDTLWYTRCPVPTASGIAHGLGTLADAASGAGLDFRILQDADAQTALHHFDHQLTGLIREGGNVPALAARAAVLAAPEHVEHRLQHQRHQKRQGPNAKAK